MDIIFEVARVGQFFSARLCKTFFHLFCLFLLRGSLCMTLSLSPVQEIFFGHSSTLPRPPTPDQKYNGSSLMTTSLITLLVTIALGYE